MASSRVASDGITGRVPVLRYLTFTPELGEAVALADNAFVVGKVRVAGPAALGQRAVLRGDQNWIEVAPRFRIGERSTIHVEFEAKTQIGHDVWLGDDVVVHACTLGDEVRVEHGGLVLSNARVGSGSIVDAAALVPEGVEFPDNSFISGTPARRLRDTSPEERAETRRRIETALNGSA
jgi:carbonic anhydrase/acetyltransferase-like protein (isoleucine patch superfamily)